MAMTGAARSLVTLAFASALSACAQGTDALLPRELLLRSGSAPEWDEFAAAAPHGRRLDLPFSAPPGEATLLIRQRDVKLEWTVELNGRKIGMLEAMEFPQVHALPASIRPGENVLSIVPPAKADDIVVGEIRIETRPLATVEVEVNEGALPCRITVADSLGALAPIRAEPDPRLAVRTGVIYTIDGRARFGVHPGTYAVTAGRGFEWSIDERKIEARPGETTRLSLKIRREVPTPGLVACDTHIHTRELSGHGDATVAERGVTLAGEGIELAVTTEHNQNRAYPPSPHFTVVAGNEVTTKRGHFNVFPARTEGPVPDASLTDWARLADSIRASGARVAILNHPRDLHAGFRPFDPANFGTVRDALFVDAIEAVNSGANLSDPMSVTRDAFTLLQAGRKIALIGASDSHDVARNIVGQGRTYVRVPDGDPAKIDVDRACSSFLEGRVMASLGLLCLLEADGTRLRATVLGPSWTRCDRLEIFMNGERIRDEKIEPSASIEKARVEWTVARPARDSWVLAIASGPGVTAPYWPLAKPYQPTSTAWVPRLFGSSEIVRLAVPR